MVDNTERLARMALSCIVEPGDPRLRERLRRQGPTEVWQAVRASQVEDPWVRRAAVLELGAVQEAARRVGVRFVVPGEAEWPESVDDLAFSEPVQEMGGAPIGLWLRGRGDRGSLTTDAVALVGSRASTAYGDRTATEMAADLAGSGTTVVSGGAYGIDAAAHRGALAGEGPTLAVLAGGLDELYPRAHTALLEQVAASGLLVSEAPPFQHPSRRRFLARNRLIAALCTGVVIVEAGARSGARNTATWAGTLGRHLMAVPGPVSSATSYTPHRLIREGEATLVTGAADVREMVAPMGECLTRHHTQPRLLDLLAPEEMAVYEALPARGSRDTGDLALRAGLSLPVTLYALEALRARRLVAAAPDGGWKLGAVQDRPLSSTQQQGGG